jgi:hypothetical protein
MMHVKSFLIAMIPFLVLALTGCESVEENSGSFWSQQEDGTTVADQTQTPAPTAPADETPNTGGEVGDNTFLWKPVSETRGGRVAVLLPANMSASTITVNGESPAEVGSRANGNRQHFYLRQTGAAYGQNVAVIAFAGGSVLRQWTVPDGASRWGSN